MVAIAATHAGTQSLQVKLLQTRVAEARRQVLAAQTLVQQLEQQTRDANAALQGKNQRAQVIENEWLKAQSALTDEAAQQMPRTLAVDTNALNGATTSSANMESIEGYLNRYRLLAADTTLSQSEQIHITV